MKILVIGSNGLIGKTFCETYRKKLNIATCARKENLNKKLKTFKPELILNLAADVRNINKMFTSNFSLVKKLVNYTIKHNNYLIQIGSSAEYGKRNFPTDENTSLMPASVYEVTKSLASILVTGFSRTFNSKAIVVRPYCVYGVYSKKNRLIPIVINSLKKNKKINIYKGNQDYIYVKDFVRALKIIIDKRKKWILGEVINVGSGKQYSNIQVVQTIEKVFKKKINYNYIKKYQKYMDSDMWLSNPAYIKKKYGFKSKYSLRDGLEDMKKILIKKI